MQTTYNFATSVDEVSLNFEVLKTNKFEAATSNYRSGHRRLKRHPKPEICGIEVVS